MAFPTFEQYKAKLKKSKDKWMFKNTFIQEYFHHSIQDEYMSNTTSESLCDDENYWINDTDNDEFWETMLTIAMRSIRSDARARIPDDVLEKYMNKKELIEFNRLKKIKLLEKL